MKTSRSIPPESARAGVQEDSRTDHMVLDSGMEMTMTQKTRTEYNTAAAPDPYRLVKSLFDKERGGFLRVAIKELEEYLRNTYSDARRQKPVTVPDDMPPIHPLKHQIDIRPPTWNEVLNIGKQARTASAPAPNGMLYKVYKNNPRCSTSGGCYGWLGKRELYLKHGGGQEE